MKIPYSYSTKEKNTERLKQKRKELSNVQNHLFAGFIHSLGLKSDGTVVAVGDNVCRRCDVKEWKLFNDYKNIEKERLEFERKEKERLEFERKEKERLEFERKEQERKEKERLELERKKQERLEFERKEQERKEKERLELERKKQERLEQLNKMKQYRSQGVCQYCGGVFKGLIFKKCASCGRKKDY